jgi:sigma-B regulation protein RsbU (phosphoserine phosphatase)
MTLFLAIVDPRTAALRWASAGHASAHWRRDAGVTPLPRTGPALGALPGAVYGAGGPMRLAPGDAVVLYTDGLHEARNASDELYGEERFLDSVASQAARHERARPVLDGVLADFGAWVGDRPAADDVTCVVLRALP